jgi:hypothetical protein
MLTRLRKSVCLLQDLVCQLIFYELWEDSLNFLLVLHIYMFTRLDFLLILKIYMFTRCKCMCLLQDLACQLIFCGLCEGLLTLSLFAGGSQCTRHPAFKKARDLDVYKTMQILVPTVEFRGMNVSLCMSSGVVQVLQLVVSTGRTLLPI